MTGIGRDGIVLPMDTRDLASAVQEYALEHYTEGGWDVVVECYSLSDIVDRWTDHNREFGTPIPTTVDEAIASFDTAVSIWSDQQADARNSAF